MKPAPPVIRLGLHQDSQSENFLDSETVAFHEPIAILQKEEAISSDALVADSSELEKAIAYILEKNHDLYQSVA